MRSGAGPNCSGIRTVGFQSRETSMVAVRFCALDAGSRRVSLDGSRPGAYASACSRGRRLSLQPCSVAEQKCLLRRGSRPAARLGQHIAVPIAARLRACLTRGVRQQQQQQRMVALQATHTSDMPYSSDNAQRAAALQVLADKLALEGVTMPPAPRSKYWYRSVCPFCDGGSTREKSFCLIIHEGQPGASS